MQEIEFPPSAAVTLAVGRLDAVPTAGTFKLTYGANTTPELSYNISASELQTALNALASITADGGVTVTKSGNQFKIVWDDKGVFATALTASTDALFPTSQASIVETKAGSATANRIVLFKLKQSAIGALQTWTPISAPVISITNIFSKTWRVSISPSPKDGVFSLTITRNGTPYITSPIGYNDDALRVASVLNATGTQDGSYTVIKSGDFSWDITAPSTVTNFTSSSGLLGFSALYGVLDLNTAECEEFLSGLSSAEATLEVQADISGEIQTLIQTNVTVLNDLIDVSSFNVVAFEDVMPVDSVVRYDTAQALTAAQQLQARDNIDAVGSADISSIEADVLALDGRVTATESDISALESLVDQNVTETGTPIFDAVYNYISSGELGIRLISGGISGKIQGSAPIVDWTTGQRFFLNAEEGFALYDAGTSYVTMSPNQLSISDGTSSIGLTGTEITFPDSTVQSSAFIPANYLSKSGNLSGLSSASAARTNLGLGTMATETASNYLTTANATATYLTIANAATTYAPIADQTVNTSDAVRFAEVLVGDALISETALKATGLVFPTTAELQNVEHSAGTSIHSGGGGHIDSNDYPDEITIVVNGTTYRVPARTI
jgi:hypothetical protein